MKKPILVLAAASLLLIGGPAKAYSGAEIALGVIGGIILGGVITQQPRPGVYYSPPITPPNAVYYSHPGPVYSYPQPMPCYNRPSPVYDAWGRHVGWQEIRVCQ